MNRRQPSKLTLKVMAGAGLVAEGVGVGGGLGVAVTRVPMNPAAAII